MSIHTQVQECLMAIQQLNASVQEHLVNKTNPLLMHTKIEKLAEHAASLKKMSSQLQPHETKLIELSLDQLSKGIDLLTASQLALFQAACNTLSQLLPLPHSAEVNVQALLDQNQLAQLTSSLQDQHDPTTSHDLIESMQKPLTHLLELAVAGSLSEEQEDLVVTLSECYQNEFCEDEMPAHLSISQFQNVLEDLKTRLTEK